MKRLLYLEFWWAVHNLIGHPVSQLLWWLSLCGLIKPVAKLSDWAHDWTVPVRDSSDLQLIQGLRDSLVAAIAESGLRFKSADIILISEADLVLHGFDAAQDTAAGLIIRNTLNERAKEGPGVLTPEQTAAAFEFGNKLAK